MNTKISVKERPILFSSAMVRAILEERKTQTRRVVSGVNGADQFVEFRDGYAVFTDTILDKFSGSPHLFHVRCPYGQPGDRLWVRETWTCPGYETWKPSEIEQISRYPFVHYRTDFEKIGEPRYYTWRPSIFMPRWASRILLEITDIRVQRVQEITPDDAYAEGMFVSMPAAPIAECFGMVGRFRGVWDDINFKRGFGWNRNPWVWAISFRRVE